MPNTRSAEKTAVRSKTRHERLLPYKTRMKTTVKKLMTAAKAGKKEDMKGLLSEAFKSIDMAAKKHIIHPNNAARKKSRVARIVAAMK